MFPLWRLEHIHKIGDGVTFFWEMPSLDICTFLLCIDWMCEFMLVHNGCLASIIYISW